MSHHALSGGGGHHHHGGGRRRGGGGWYGGGPGWGWGPQQVVYSYPEVVAVPVIAAPAPTAAAPTVAAPAAGDMMARANAFLRTPVGMASLGLAAYLLFFRKGG